MLTFDCLEDRSIPSVLASTGGVVYWFDEQLAITQTFRPFEEQASQVPLYLDADSELIYIGAGIGGGPRFQVRSLNLQVVKDVFVGDMNSRTGVSVAAFSDSIPQVFESKPNADHALVVHGLGYDREVLEMVAGGVKDLNVNVTNVVPKRLPGDRFAEVYVGDNRNGLIATYEAGKAPLDVYGKDPFDPPGAWVDSRKVGGKTQLASAILHEWGHLLGLEHTNDRNSLMQPSLTSILQFTASEMDVLRSKIHE